MRILVHSSVVLISISSTLLAVQTVDSIKDTSNPGVEGLYVWHDNNTRGAGTASVEDGVPAGGSLPTGAARLTTSSANYDKAEVGMNVSWLFDADFVEAFSASYEHYNAGMNAAAAPSLKLVLWRPNTPSGYDGYGELIYEPYWQGGGNPVHDQWLTENITGESGAWWTTGVFGQPGSAGGPPVRTLSEWLGLFSTGDTGYDASTTIVTQIYMGVGSYNPGVDSFFDNLSINVPDFSETYDFETPAASVPEGGATIFLFALAGGLLVGGRRLINPR